MSYVKVINNNVDRALKKLKKKMATEGMFKEWKKRKHYEKPSDKRRRKKAESRKRKMQAMKYNY